MLFGVFALVLFVVALLAAFVSGRLGNTYENTSEFKDMAHLFFQWSLAATLVSLVASTVFSALSLGLRSGLLCLLCNIFLAMVSAAIGHGTTHAACIRCAERAVRGITS